MKNRKIITLIIFVISLVSSVYFFKNFKFYYLVKKGNNSYYSKNYDEALEFYNKALGIKNNTQVEENLSLTYYAKKDYQKVLDSNLDLNFYKGNSIIKLSESNNNPQELEGNYQEALEFYKEAMLKDNDINIKKNYEIIDNKLKSNQDNKTTNNEKQEEKKNQNKQDNEENNSQDNQNLNKENNNQDNKNNQDKQNDTDKEKQEQENKNTQKKQTNEQNKSKTSSDTSSSSKPLSEKEEKKKELEAVLMRLENNEKQSFKNNERLIGVGSDDSENKW